MTQVHFTLNNKEVQSIIEQSVKDEVSKNILTTVFNQLMENQRTEYIQADDYERSESRQSQRNGYYERDFTTRVGTLELKVPRTRDGEFAPTVFERYQRNERHCSLQCLRCMFQAFRHVKFQRLLKSSVENRYRNLLFLAWTEQLDPMVKEWQNRSLSGTNYPYLMTDVLYIKVREDHRVLSKSCHIAIGITEGGDREIIGFMIQNEESDDTWSIFFDYLKERGLQGTELIISDAHKGLVSAIRRSFTNASWQRCQVHFLRNIFSSIPKKNSKPFREAVKAIFKFTDIELARTAKNALVGEYIDQSKYTKACETLDNGFEDAFQYTVIGNGHNRLKSTNLLERLNQEVRRREKIIRIFPNRASANRLIGAVLMDLHDEWLSSTRKYIKFNQ